MNQGLIVRNYLKGTGEGMGEIAKRLNLTRQGLNYHLRKDILDMSFISLLKINYPDLTFQNENEGDFKSPGLPKFEQSSVEIGEIIIDDENENSPFIPLGNGQFIMVVPLVPIKAQAGYAENFTDTEFIEGFKKHTFPVTGMHNGKYMAFIVRGHSMDDGTSGAIIEGSIVTGREIQRHHWRNKLHLHRFEDYIIVYDGEVVVKRIINHDTEKGVITCHSLNPDKKTYPDYELELDRCKQIFNIVNVTQNR